MSKRYAIFLTALFCGFLAVFFAANLISPDRDFSQDENRYLAQKPELDAGDFALRLPLEESGDFFTGKFMSDFETYLTDQFVFRDQWIAAKAMAERLARIAGVSLDEIGKELYAAGSTDAKSAEELFRADYKQFHIAEQNIGVSQITCVDADHLLARREEFLTLMAQLKEKQEFDMVILMITDVLQEGSHIFYVGNDDTIRQAFNKEPHDNYLFLKGVMSRKKQIIPMLTALWG